MTRRWKKMDIGECPVPNCPADKRVEPDPACTCYDPIWLVIPPGGHFHPCKVHPDFVIYGPSYTL